jgi:hypothetical protein
MQRVSDCGAQTSCGSWYICAKDTVLAQRVVFVFLAGWFPVTTQAQNSDQIEDRIKSVSIAVIHHGKIEWARGFWSAIQRRRSGQPRNHVSSQVHQQAFGSHGGASSCAGGKLALDSNINEYLTSWSSQPLCCRGKTDYSPRTIDTHRRNNGARIFGICQQRTDSGSRASAERRKTRQLFAVNSRR